jgi:hypothetical protein
LWYTTKAQLAFFGKYIGWQRRDVGRRREKSLEKTETLVVLEKKGSIEFAGKVFVGFPVEKSIYVCKGGTFVA